ncbi:MAG TPA: PKD domain-containing protein [Patescibacteria group bacterium]
MLIILGLPGVVSAQSFLDDEISDSLINSQTKVLINLQQKSWKTFVFESSVNLIDSGQLTYSWDFDDGQTADGRGVEHKFKKSGDYLVAVVITDDQGNKLTELIQVEISFFNPGNWKVWSLVILLIILIIMALIFIGYRPKKEAVSQLIDKTKKIIQSEKSALTDKPKQEPVGPKLESDKSADEQDWEEYLETESDESEELAEELESLEK